MNDNKEKFIRFGLGCLGFKSKQDVYENLYLKAIIDSYGRIEKAIGLENNIRDRFVWDFVNTNQITCRLFNDGILQIDLERYHFISQNEKKRTDLTFFISGLGNFTFECKRLFKKNSKNEAYINEGLKRFIDSQYSRKDDYAGMLGFVVSGDIATIRSELLNKCRNANYIANDFTRQKYAEWTHSIKTAHSRNGSTDICIYHLFFEFDK